MEREPTPLRRARQARNWTLEDDEGAPSTREVQGSSGMKACQIIWINYRIGR
ncbi:hypothetical protein [Streptosporangium saharense]|uniref:hypothetical protein n=1 Tax=Streptosporangium saharense TaxID=1706840 RepID=UPI003697370B